MIKQVDVNGDETISYEEFLALFPHATAAAALELKRSPSVLAKVEAIHGESKTSSQPVVAPVQPAAVSTAKKPSDKPVAPEQPKKLASGTVTKDTPKKS